jgi:hypothetical protein
VVVGAGLIASLWLGRARGLVPLGLALATIMLAGATFGSWFADDAPSPRERAMAYLMGSHSAPGSTTSNGSEADVGNLTLAPGSLGELESRYEIGVGNLVLDLSHIDFSGQKRDLDIEVGLGNLTIIVPAHVVVLIDGEVGVGKADTFGRSQNGLDFDVDYNDDDSDSAVMGKLEIDYEVGMGKAEVRRGSL